MYKYVDARVDVVIMRMEDGAILPLTTEDESYLAWVAEGNEPAPADPLPAPSYVELRAAEYPPIAEQLDALWKGGEAAEEMRIVIMAVKEKYPKDPE